MIRTSVRNCRTIVEDEDAHLVLCDRVGASTIVHLPTEHVLNDRETTYGGVRGCGIGDGTCTAHQGPLADRRDDEVATGQVGTRGRRTELLVRTRIGHGVVRVVDEDGDQVTGDTAGTVVDAPAQDVHTNTESSDRCGGRRSIAEVGRALDHTPRTSGHTRWYVRRHGDGGGCTAHTLIGTCQSSLCRTISNHDQRCAARDRVRAYAIVHRPDEGVVTRGQTGHLRDRRVR